MQSMASLSATPRTAMCAAARPCGVPGPAIPSRPPHVAQGALRRHQPRGRRLGTRAQAQAGAEAPSPAPTPSIPPPAVSPRDGEWAPREWLRVGDASGPTELAPPEEDLTNTPLSAAASIVVTGGLTLILVRTFRRRAAKAKEDRLRADVVGRLSPKQAELEKAKADLAAASKAEPASPVPSPLSAFSGALVAGLLSYVAYNFATGVDDMFRDQPLSANYTVRQITITIRTIVSGLGWLATGVFGANSLGLFLYGGQLALGLDKDSKDKRESIAAAAEKESMPVKDEEKAQQ